MHEYRYIGKEMIALPSYGYVYPNECIKMTYPVNHPLFQEILKSKKNVSKKKYN